MKAHQTDFSSGRVSKSILDVTLPMLAAQIMNLLYNIVDRVYIGKMPGTGLLALSGVGLCFPVIMLVTAFSNLFGTGGAPLFSIARGKGDAPEAEKIMGTSFLLLLIAGAVLTVVGSLFGGPLLYLFGASDATYPFARDYLSIYLIGTIAVMISLGMNPFVNGQGFSRVGMLTVALGAVTNIILDPIFIFVFHMGVRGAALATILSQLLSCVWVLRFLTGGKAEISLKLQGLKLRWRRIRRILSLGVTGFVFGFTNSLVQVTCNTTLQTFGGDAYIGVMTVLTSIREIASLPIMSLSNGASPVISYSYGARRYERIRQAIKFITFSALGVTLLIWALIFFFPAFFIHIFSSDAHLLELGIPALRIYFVGFFMISLQFAGQTLFTALGKAKSAVFFSLLRKAFIVVPLTLLLPRLWGLGGYGVFWAEPISNFIGGAACFTTMLIVVLPELRRAEKAQADTSAAGMQG